MYYYHLLLVPLMAPHYYQARQHTLDIEVALLWLQRRKKKSGTKPRRPEASRLAGPFDQPKLDGPPTHQPPPPPPHPLLLLHRTLQSAPARGFRSAPLRSVASSSPLLNGNPARRPLLGFLLHHPSIRARCVVARREGGEGKAMAPMKLYGSTLSWNVTRCVAVLEEAGAEYEIVPLDFSKGEHKAPDHLARNVRAHRPSPRSLVVSFLFVTISLSRRRDMLFPCPHFQSTGAILLRPLISWDLGVITQ